MINSSFLTKFEIYDFPLLNQRITTFFLTIVYCGDMDGCTLTHQDTDGITAKWEFMVYFDRIK